MPYEKFLLIAVLLISQSAWTQTRDFFDDFSYNGNNDQRLIDFGWEPVNGTLKGAIIDRNNITFHQIATGPSTNTLMFITATTADSFKDMRWALIETSEFIFWEGTYAARVYFDDTPIRWNDGNVQAFYSLNVPRFNNDPDYSECDFEYLAWDVWGGANTNSKLYTVTWESWSNEPFIRNRAYSVLEESLHGWHVLLFTAVDSKTVRYYLDGDLIAEHTTSTSGDSVYPEAPMNISFINSIATDQQGSGLGESQDKRSCIMKVDWVYHAENILLTTSEVEDKVDWFRQNGIARRNTMKLVTDIPDNINPPKIFGLEQNYPNPFNRTTVIKYSVPKTSQVNLVIFNVLGQKVAEMVNEVQNAGTYKVAIDLIHIIGSSDSGIYFYQLRTGEYMDTKKMILIK